MRGLLLAALLLATPAAGQETFRSAAAFLATCDARPDAAGERPPESVPCLSYMAGMIEGYTAGAIAGGIERPYCLPRPVTLVEMMDMMATVIERGVPPTLPTAAVFHIILRENFPCDAASSPAPRSAPAPAPSPAPETAE